MAVREYVHVADLADAYVAALPAAEPGTHRVFNVGSGVGTTIRDVIGAVEEVSGRPLPIERRPAQNESQVLMADSGLIRDQLGWQAQRSDILSIIKDAWAALDRA